MAQKMTGALVFDERTDRYDIRFDLFGRLGLPQNLQRHTARRYIGIEINAEYCALARARIGGTDT